MALVSAAVAKADEPFTSEEIADLAFHLASTLLYRTLYVPLITVDADRRSLIRKIEPVVTEMRRQEQELKEKNADGDSDAPSETQT